MALNLTADITSTAQRDNLQSFQLEEPKDKFQINHRHRKVKKAASAQEGEPQVLCINLVQISG